MIECFNLNFNLGNAIKYILRSGKKGDASQDLMKAVWYLTREAENLQKDIEMVRPNFIRKKYEKTKMDSEYSPSVEQREAT